ncbi:MAG: hypothetical protein ACREOP_09500 [Thermodesulfobacteriota bacterium]
MPATRENLRTFIITVNETRTLTYRTLAKSPEEAERLIRASGKLSGCLNRASVKIDSKVVTDREYGEVEEISGE